MIGVPRCLTCNGPVLASSCLHCGRSPELERVSLGEALYDNLRPSSDKTLDVSSFDATSRQKIPVAVSLARAEAWLKEGRA
jgi:hypothetical protein